MKKIILSVLLTFSPLLASAGPYDGLDMWAVTSDTTTRTVSGGFAVAASTKTWRNFVTRIDGTRGITSSLQITASSITAVGDMKAQNFVGALTGNAATVTNGVYTSGSYSDPSWITSLAASKIAAGSLGSSVLVSSVAIPAFYNNATIRSNLGLAIGTNVQAWDADLDDLSDGSLSASKVASGYPAAYVASGSLGSSVIVSSHAVASVQDSAIVGVAGSKVSGNISGNAGTATALAADPSDCTLPNVALGITASGAATCGQPSSITGNAATVTNGVYTTTAFGGDVSGTAGATIVGNDSHTHAPASLSGVVLSTGATMSGSLRNTVNLNVGDGTGEMYITPNQINQSGALQNMEVGTAGTGSLLLKTAATNRLFITAGGNVSIGGDTNPTAKLVVDGNVVSSGNVQAVAFYGSGANLTNLPAGGGAAVLAATQTWTGSNTFNSATTIANPTMGSNYCGISTYTSTGNIGGWVAVHNSCNSVCGTTTGHMCTWGEVSLFTQLSNTALSASNVRINQPDAVANFSQNLCNGWASSSSAIDSMVYQGGYINNSYPTPSNCANSLAFACCK